MSVTELDDHLQRYLAVRFALGYRNYALRNLMLDFVRYVIAVGWRQSFLPLATFILAGLEPSSLVHHRAV